MDKDFIKSFWENQGYLFDKSYRVSWGDINAINLEIQEISKHIHDSEIVLDAGCANGYSTLQQSKLHQLKQFIAIDYVEKLIDLAKEEAAIENNSNIDFRVGNVKYLDFLDNYFDVVYTTRVLINLPNWNEQITAIEELIRVTKPKGKIILSEAFWEPLCKLNSVRLLFGLQPLVEHDFNRYLKKEKLEAYLKEHNYKYECIDFSSVYYLGSRLIRELLENSNELKDYTNQINNTFYELEQSFSGGNVGIQQLYIIDKG